MQIFLQFCGDLNMTLKHPNQANDHKKMHSTILLVCKNLLNTTIKLDIC